MSQNGNRKREQKGSAVTMQKAGGILTTVLRVIGALVLAVLVLVGGILFGSSFVSDSELDYTDMRETTLEEQGELADYGMYNVDLLVIDLLSQYTDDTDEYDVYSYYYCLAAFADGAGDINLCIFELSEYDECCSKILSYLADDTQQIGDCRLSGTFVLYPEEDSELYTDELAVKDTWITEHQDSLAELGTLLGLDSSAGIVDSERIMYLWADETSFSDIFDIVNTALRVIGGGLMLVGIVGLWLLLRPRKAKAKKERRCPAPPSAQEQTRGNPAAGRWESAALQGDTPVRAAPQRPVPDEDAPRAYDSEAYAAAHMREPWSGAQSDDPWDRKQDTQDEP